PANPYTLYITRTWVATDCCNNNAGCTQTVTVTDTTPPDVVCATNKTVECGSQWTFDDPTASDLCCPAATISIIVVGDTTNSTAGALCTMDITRTWEIRDCCGNHTNCSQTITVVDTTAPVLTCAPSKTVE